MQLHLFSVGHGTLDGPTFTARLRAAAIASVADIRRYPGSRLHPHFNADALRVLLRSAAIDYHAMPELGGRRTPLPDSANVALRNAGFRGFADYMQTPAFSDQLTGLLMLAADRPTAMMCSETLWWRCHRRLVADAVVLLHGGRVTHVTGAMTAEHVPTPGVRRDGERLVYDAGVQRLS